ncbi:MAG: hypothetical protein Q4B85_11115 [Lachnospiraceae bacterium]|nr:hypothetical protein [Lachnospiraceae bacterium]
MNYRKFSKTAGAFLAMAVCSLMIWGCGNGVDGYYDGMKWGTTYENAKTVLKEKEGAEPAENADGSKLILEVENYRGVEGVTGKIECSFDGQKLDEVFIYLGFDENTFTNEEIMDQYEAILTEELGKCSKSAKDSKIWKLSDSEVQLANFTYGMLVMDYMPKN